MQTAALDKLPDGEITQWLSQFETPSPDAGAHPLTLLYDELRRMARQHLRRENPGHALRPTGLAHEAWLRMAGQTRTQWKNRSHFLAVCSTMMRRILVNHELARRAARRDAELVPVTMSDLAQLAAPPDRDLLAVHEALLAFEEVAEALGLSLSTVKRDWVIARAWLHRALSGSEPADVQG